MGDMLEASFLNPNQWHCHGIIVNDCPIHLSPDPSLATHTIYSPQDEMCIPMQLKGIVLFFTSHFPTNHELELQMDRTYLIWRFGPKCSSVQRTGRQNNPWVYRHWPPKKCPHHRCLGENLQLCAISCLHSRWA